MKDKYGLYYMVCDDCGWHYIITELPPKTNCDTYLLRHENQKNHCSESLLLEDFLKEGRRLIEKEQY